MAEHNAAVIGDSRRNKTLHTTPEEDIVYGNEEGFKMANYLQVFWLDTIFDLKKLGLNDFLVQWKASIDEANNNFRLFYSLIAIPSNHGWV